MQQSLNPLFLSQSYQDAWDDYMRALTRPAFARWDYVILTASNERQAQGYRMQLDQRIQAGLLPVQTTFLVIPDPEGKRVGSGGATLGVICRLVEEMGKADFSGKRILVIHSGGDSKRIPQYSALGKLFSPVPHELPNGQTATLFDEVMISMSGVPARIQEGMVFLSGDVLLLFNPLQIDFSGHGAAAISFKESVSVGKNHGVYLRGADGNIERFLHKQTEATLRAAGAVNEHDCVDIDTGAVIFSAEMVRSLYGLLTENGRFSPALFDRFVNEKTRLSLYGDFLFPLATNATLEQFYQEAPEGAFTPELREARTEVWRALRPYRMKLMRLAPAKFLHFGTTLELLKLMTEEVSAYSRLGWEPCVNSSIAQEAVAGYCSVLSNEARCGAHCYLEVSYVHPGATIGENTILSHIDIYDEEIPANIVLHGLKQRDGKFVARIYGIHDNPKENVQSGATLFGQPLQTFLDRNGLTTADLWEDGQETTLWEAKLYPACDTIADAVQSALHVYRLAMGEGNVALWRSSVRKSLRAGFTDADPQALLAWNQRMQELVRMDRLAKLIYQNQPATMAAEVLQTHKLTPVQENWLLQWEKRADFSHKMRMQYYIGKALGGVVGEEYIGRCFQTIQDHIIQELPEHIQLRRDLRIVRQQHTVRLPLRVNFGGGWSDTPPYCNERGGTVLNAAVLLNGEKPVEVTVTRLDARKIVFSSEDMGAYGEFTDLQSLQERGNPYDPFALQKAALLACGVVPMSGGDLPALLEQLGGGFHVRTEVHGVPKGSGLGTSSILAGACVKALHGFFGIPSTEPQLYDRVLCMEQLMSTGGGWQDQVGGLTPGIKYITSRPGVPQKLDVQPLKLDGEDLARLNDRLCLIYTGQRRLARNLLREVVQSYIGNDPKVVFALNEIQRIAALMRFELERGNLTAFGALMDEHWGLSQQIDGGSSNTLIDQIFMAVDDLIDGRMICGAGGGGFLQVLLKETATKKQVQSRLQSVFQDCEIGVWDTTLLT